MMAMPRSEQLEHLPSGLAERLYVAVIAVEIQHVPSDESLGGDLIAFGELAE